MAAGREPLDAFFEKVIAGTDFTTTCAYSTVNPALTYEGIKAAIDSLPPIKPEPIGEYMRAHGFPPEDGWLLFMPESMRDKAGPFPPTYVRFSALIDAPIMLPGHLL